ncbi:MAG TPA: PspA/IM30 family protein, partial [Mobilitalea sp.]|nr:PspA/IM30 family protein [Mobilitalea sp.]
QERINRMGSSVVNANNSMASFAKYEEMADRALDKANAMAELNQSSNEQTIEDLTKKYSVNSSVEDELAALKANLNK